MPGKRKKEPPISYRPPKALRHEFFARVERSGLCTNAFITKAVFGLTMPRQTRRPPVEKQLLARILGVLQNLSDALKQFSAAAERDPEIKALLRDIKSLMQEIRAALFKFMGRKP